MKLTAKRTTGLQSTLLRLLRFVHTAVQVNIFEFANTVKVDTVANPFSLLAFMEKTGRAYAQLMVSLMVSQLVEYGEIEILVYAN